MIAIKNADEQTSMALCERLSLPLCLVLEMTDRDQTLGLACAEFRGEEALVHYLEAPEGALTDALLRATLNAVRAEGMKTARILHGGLHNHMLRKGYFGESSRTDIKIADFFAKTCCNG